MSYEYYNVVNNTLITKPELQKEFNVSIGEGLDFGNWKILQQDPIPEGVAEGSYAVPGDVVVRDGVPYRTWNVITPEVSAE